MGFFSKKRDRTPDLSRYSAHYESQSRTSSLSNDAAAAALRTYSMNSGYQNPYQLQQRQQRTSSLRNNAYRSNSLSQRNQRHSLRSNSLRSNSIQYGQNPIIIHTRETVDEFGRTKSITTETIQQFGTYEIVKRETNTDMGLNSSGFLVPPLSFTGSSGRQGSLLSNELGSIREEEEEFAGFSGAGVGDYTPLTQKAPAIIAARPIKSILKNASSPTNSEDAGSDDEHNSIYSDAMETLPSERDVRFKKITVISEPTPHTSASRNSSFTRQRRQSSVAIPPAPVSLSTSKRLPPPTLSEAEAYQRALEIAAKRVYGTPDGVPPIAPRATQQRKNSFKHSLRDEASTTSAPTRIRGSQFGSAAPEASDSPKARSPLSRFFRFLSGGTKVRN